MSKSACFGMEAKVRGPRLSQFHCIPFIIYVVYIAAVSKPFKMKYNIPLGAKKEMRNGEEGEGPEHR